MTLLPSTFELSPVAASPLAQPISIGTLLVLMCFAQAIRVMIEAHREAMEEERERDNQAAKHRYKRESFLREEIKHEVIQRDFVRSSFLQHELQV